MQQRTARPPRPILTLVLLGGLLTAASIDRAGSTEPPPAIHPALGDLTIEELSQIRIRTVSSASRYQQSIADAPAAITVVDGSEIRALGCRTLADVLAGIEGCYVSDNRDYSFLGVRGLSRPGDFNNRVLLLIDGHRLNENIYQSAPLGTEFPVDIDLVDHVEVARGPGFAAFGNNALLAVVNVVTRSGGSANGIELAADAGGGSRRGARLTWGRHTSRGTEQLAAGWMAGADGERSIYFPAFDSPGDGMDGVARDIDHDSNAGFLARFSRPGLSLATVYGSREKQIPTGVFETTFGDGRTRTIDRWGFLEGRLMRSAGPLGDLTTRLAYDYYRYQGDYAYDELLNRDLALSSSLTGEVQTLRKIPERGTFVAGAEVLANLRQSQENFDLQPPAWHYRHSESETNWALYAQGELNVGPWLIAGAGVRLDRFESFGGTTNPRLSLIAHPSAASTIKLAWGRAFRAPNFTELYYDDGSSMRRNPGLRPEQSSTSQATWEQELGRRIQFAVTAFQYTVDDLIDQVVDPVDSMLVFRNQGRVCSRGVEAALAGRLASGVRLRASATRQAAEDAAEDRTLSNAPGHLLKGSLILPLPPVRTIIGIEVQSQSRVRSVHGEQIPAITLVNATVSAPHLTRHLMAAISIHNLFDRSYDFPAGPEFTPDRLPQRGRTLRMHVTWRGWHRVP